MGIFIYLPASAGQVSHLEYLTSLSIEELMKIKVSSTGFFDMSHQKAPGTIWLLSNQDIENSSAMNMSDLLNFYIPGIHIGNNVRYGSLIASRGIAMPNNSSTLFLLDGQGINAGVGVGVNSGLKLPLLGDIDRLEIINGPCSIVHGSGAINGFVNIIPKTGSDYPGYFINTDYGFIEKLIKTEIGYGYSYGQRKDFFIYAGGARAQGFEADIAAGTKNRSNKLDVYGMNEPNYKWALYWRHNLLKLDMVFQKEIYDNNSYETSLAESSISRQTSFIVHPEIELDFSQYESLALSLPFEFFDTGVNYNNLNRKQDEGSSEFHIETKSVFKTTRLKNQKIALGSLIGLRHFKAGSYFFSENPVSPGTTVNADWAELGIFFEDIYRITPEWTLSAGLRYDLITYNSASSPNPKSGIQSDNAQDKDLAPANEDILTPRIATSYEINRANIIKFSYQEGFHYPNLKYFEYTQNIGAELRPEKVTSYEINYHFDLKKYKAGFDFNLYYNIFCDSFLAKSRNNEAAVTSPSEKFDAYTNAPEEFAALGGELVIQYQPSQDTNLRFSYGYSRPRDHGDQGEQIIFIASRSGTSWTRYPDHIIKSDITQKFMNNRLILNLGFLYNSPVDTEDPKTREIVDHNRFILNLYAKYQISDNLSFKFTGQNLLQNDVPPVSNYTDQSWNGNTAIDKPLVYLGLTWKY
ncbi:TonB-dependent receptor-like superfamily protein [Desulfonema limicola]|uniref:TonB-dependent receptor-like superfamily protein n=2 Tax=Desulfonema limicola TaxID=45656 RepID=A0A975B3H1_9BACT|nr:TonB-dependent receptor-like superfamily protein [Desulfonema limicola]